MVKNCKLSVKSDGVSTRVFLNDIDISNKIEKVEIRVSGGCQTVAILMEPDEIEFNGDNVIAKGFNNKNVLGEE